ncbi:MAG: NAD-dependent epimerase/dehydratase family protein [Candidatus Pacebacteria bacterium]|nr:NAD-dependent epimerase/dehydratase family protein [Candidatus Paceibacterota bacterium]
MSGSKQILITGGTGFAGSHLAEYLLETEPDATIHLTTLHQGAERLPDTLGKATIHELDLANLEQTQALFTEVQPNEIYHLAAMAEVGSSFEQAAKITSVNMQLQLSVLTALQTITPLARILIIGSALEYGKVEPSELPITEDQPFRPLNPYAVSKVAQDLLAYAYAQSYGLQILRVRPFNHTGERQTTAFAIPAFAEQIVKVERGEQTTLRVGNLAAIRDILDVKDVVRAYTVVMQRGVVGEVYNIGSGVGVSMQTIVDGLIQLAQVPITIAVDEARLRPADIPELRADIQKISALGWQPEISLTDTLQRIIEFWRSIT